MTSKIIACVAVLSIWFGFSDVKAGDLNSQVIDAVNGMLADPGRKDTKYGGGWYGQELSYGSQIVHPERSPLRMCNAAVAEVIIEAVAIYLRQHPEVNIQTIATAEDWEKRGWHQLKPHLGLMDYPPEDAISDEIKAKLPNGKVPSQEIRDAFHNFATHGSMGKAFVRLGLGRTITFGKLKPGDAVTFDREKVSRNGNKSHPGHSAVFLAYLDENQNETLTYNDADPTKIKGFKYYSSQQSQKEGLGLRWAYFQGFCPKRNGDVAPTDANEVYCPDPLRSRVGIKGDYARDCCVQRPSADSPMGGRIEEPSNWTYTTAKQNLAAENKTLKERLRAYLKDYLSKQEQRIATVRGRLDAYSSHYSSLVDSIPTATNSFASRAHTIVPSDLVDQSVVSGLSDLQVLALDPLMPGRLKRTLDTKPEAREAAEEEVIAAKIRAQLKTLDSVEDQPQENQRFDGKTTD